MAGGAWEPHTQNYQVFYPIEKFKFSTPIFKVVNMGIRRLREAIES